MLDISSNYTNNTDLLEMNYIEFFIDAHNTEAYNHIMETISICNASDSDAKFHTLVVSMHREDDSTYFHVKGSWDAYKMFLRKPNVDLNLPENQKYLYSLAHYEE